MFETELPVTCRAQRRTQTRLSSGLSRSFSTTSVSDFENTVWSVWVLPGYEERRGQVSSAKAGFYINQISGSPPMGFTGETTTQAYPPPVDLMPDLVS